MSSVRLWASPNATDLQDPVRNDGVTIARAFLPALAISAPLGTLLVPRRSWRSATPKAAFCARLGDRKGTLAERGDRRCYRCGRCPRMMRVNHDYHRRGAVAYLAASTCTGPKPSVAARDASTGIAPFITACSPVVDNGFLPPAVGRRSTGSPNSSQRDHGVHPGTPAFQMNQVGRNLLRRPLPHGKVVSPNDFDDLDVVVQRLFSVDGNVGESSDAEQAVIPVGCGWGFVGRCRPRSWSSRRWRRVARRPRR